MYPSAVQREVCRGRETEHVPEIVHRKLLLHHVHSHSPIHALKQAQIFCEQNFCLGAHLSLPALTNTHIYGCN